MHMHSEQTITLFYDTPVIFYTMNVNHSQTSPKARHLRTKIKTVVSKWGKVHGAPQLSELIAEHHDCLRPVCEFSNTAKMGNHWKCWYWIPGVAFYFCNENSRWRDILLWLENHCCSESVVKEEIKKLLSLAQQRLRSCMWHHSVGKNDSKPFQSTRGRWD